MASDTFLGAVHMFAGNFAPYGYAFCQGQILPIASNQALFALLGTTYGGDGIQTFGLPNLSGRSALGTGQGIGLPPVIQGQIGGTENASLTVQNLPSHTHLATITINAANDNGPRSNNPDGSVPDSNGGQTPLYAAASDGTTMSPQTATATMGTAGNSLPVSIRNPYLGVNFIIALQGIFPSRN